MKRLKLSSVEENLAKGLFDLMEKFLKFRINGWPVYKASSLLVHCPLISGEGEGGRSGGGGGGPTTLTRRPTRNQKFFSQPNSSQLKLTQVNPTSTTICPTCNKKVLKSTEINSDHPNHRPSDSQPTQSQNLISPPDLSTVIFIARCKMQE